MAAIVVSANDTGIMVNHVPFSTHVSIWTQEDFRARLLADIAKDASTKTSVSHIDAILSAIMGVQLLPVSNYKPILGRLESIIDPVSRANETVLTNVLKSSSVGSNTKVSNAKVSFWDSGFNTEKVCAGETIKKIGTPASLLDTLNKELPNEYFPKPGGPSITFDKTFTGRLGFPFDLTWKCEATPADGKFNVEIKDTTFLDLVGEIEPGNKGPIFSPYSLGNEAKNAYINELYSLINTGEYRFIDILAEIYKHVALKGLADVAQIWMYLAYIYMVLVERYGDRIPAEMTAEITAEITAIITAIKVNTVMITTDRVVYLLCKILTLSCVYTGSREGVTSGGCTLKHYLAGPVDYSLKFKNMLENCYRKVHGHNSSIIMGLRIMSIDLNNFRYFRMENGKLRLTNGAYNTKDKVVDIKALFASVITTIEENQSAIAIIKNMYDVLEPSVFTDDAIVLQRYADFCNEIKNLKCEQIITKRRTRDYLLNVGPVLNEFAAKVGVQVEVDINNVVLSNLEYTTYGGMSLRKQVSKNRKVKGGGDYEYTKSLGYYDYVFMNYVYKKYISSIDSSVTPDIIKGNKELSVFYATLYDYCVNYYNDILIKHDVATYSKDANVYVAATYSENLKFIYNEITRVLLDKEKDEDIILIGNELSESIYFADDYYEEKKVLDATLLEEKARSERARGARARSARPIRKISKKKLFKPLLNPLLNPSLSHHKYSKFIIPAQKNANARTNPRNNKPSLAHSYPFIGAHSYPFNGGRKTKKRRKTKKNKK